MGLFGFFGRRKKKKAVPSDSAVNESGAAEYSAVIDGGEFVVTVEQLDTLSDEEKSKLVEITDESVLAEIDTMLPSVAGSGKGREPEANADAARKIVLKNSGKAVAAGGASGVKSVMSMCKSGMAGGVNPLAVSAGGVSMVSRVAGAGAAIMGVASVIVGQYYMRQVDSKIAELTDSMEKIAESLELQYKSEVTSLIESVYNVAKYQISGMAQDEVRNRELDNVQQLRKECQTLLSRAEAQIESILDKNCRTYDKYAESMREIAKWQQYQTILIKTLYQIDVLDFTLYLGLKTKEHCFGSFEVHVKKADDLQSRLSDWHDSHCKRLKISLDEGKRKKTGVISVFEKPIKLINDKWNYRSVDADTVELIRQQTARQSSAGYSTDNPFDEVQIVECGGKKYYLPKN